MEKLVSYLGYLCFFFISFERFGYKLGRAFFKINLLIFLIKLNVIECKLELKYFFPWQKQSSLYQIETTKLSIIINLEITSCQWQIT